MCSLSSSIEKEQTVSVMKKKSYRYKQLKNHLPNHISLLISFVALLVSIISLYHGCIQNSLMEDQNITAIKQLELSERQATEASQAIITVNCSETIINPLNDRNEQYEELPSFEVINTGMPCKSLRVSIDVCGLFQIDTTYFTINFGNPYQTIVVDGHSIILKPMKDDFWRESFASLNDDIQKYNRLYGIDINYELHYFLSIDFEEINQTKRSLYWAKYRYLMFTMNYGFLDEKVFRGILSTDSQIHVHEAYGYLRRYYDLDDIMEYAQRDSVITNYHFLYN